MKREEKIRQAATLARAEKEGLMASSFSKLNSDIRNEKKRIRGEESQSEEDEDRLSTVGKKRTHKEKREDDQAEEDRKERDEIRRLLRKENERNRRRE